MYRISCMLVGLLSVATCLHGAQTIKNPLHAKVDRVCLLSDNNIAILYEPAPENPEKVQIAVLDSPAYTAWRIAYVDKPCGQPLSISFGRLKENLIAIGWSNGHFAFVYPNKKKGASHYLASCHDMHGRIDGTLTKFFMDRENLFILHNHAMYMVTPHDCEDECSLSMQRLYLVHEPYEYAALSGETEAHVLALGQSDGYTQKVRLLREGKGQYEIMVAGRLSGLIGSAQNTEYVTALSSYNKAYVINTSSGVSRIIDLQPSLGAYSKPALLSACGTLLIYAAQQDEKGNRGLHIIEQEIEVPQRSCASMLLNAPGNYVQSILSNGTLVIVQTNEQLFHLPSTQKAGTESADQKKP